MRIEVKVKIDETTNHVYGFNLFDLTAVFVTFHEEVKPKGKRSWRITKCWDKYGRYTMINEPELPEIVKHYALAEINKYISIKTWNEFKTNR